MAKPSQAQVSPTPDATGLVPTELRLHSPGVHVQSAGSLMSTFRTADGWAFVEDVIGLIVTRGADRFRVPWNVVRSVHYEGP